jgi:photosystem II core protein PsbZ
LEESFYFLKKTQFYLVINLDERKFFMVGILQVFVFLLVIVSFAMVVAVPVILATPGEWEKSQSVVWSGAGLWSALVILTGIFNTVPA